MTTKETGAEIKSRILTEMAKLEPQIETAVTAGRPNASIAAECVRRIKAQPEQWFAEMTQRQTTPGKPWIVLGSYSAAELLRVVVAHEIERKA